MIGTIKVGATSLARSLVSGILPGNYRRLPVVVM